MTSVPPRDWTDIYWPDVAVPGTARWIAVLPLAATEQHGPHLPLGTDVMIAETYLAQVHELLPDTVPATFLPLQEIGISTEHVDYPGTLTLPAELALKTWLALGESVARAGIKKLVMVTSHGGNSAAMNLVAQDLRAQHGMLVVTTAWSRFGAPERGAHRQDCKLSSRQHCDGAGISLAFNPAAGAVRLASSGPSPKRCCRRRNAGVSGKGLAPHRSRRARILRTARGGR
jgi:creatinine amidohydrolase/Fe(II)-dependent formamide hydrolase-like protein